MSRALRATASFFVCVLLGILVLPGCESKKTPAKDTVAKATDAKAKDKEKGHLDFGPHGGPCAEWGDEDFHAEFIVDAGKKQVTVYILDGDAKAAPKIDVAKISDVNLTITSVKPPVPVTLKHDPKESSEKGIAYVGTHDLLANPEGMKVNIQGKVEGKPPYSGDVTYKAPDKK